MRHIRNIPGTITDEASDAAPLRGGAPLRGTSQQWADVLSGLVRDLRFDSFIFWPENPSREQVERFALEVAPAVRSSIAG